LKIFASEVGASGLELIGEDEMECTHQGYFTLAVSCEGVDLPSGGNIPAAVDTVEQVFEALAITKSFGADYRLDGKVVTFTVLSGCREHGIIPELKVVKILNGEIVVDLPAEVVF